MEKKVKNNLKFHLRVYRIGNFAIHHPQLCDAMKEGWAASYPDAWTNDIDLRFTEETVVPATVLEDDNEEDEEKKMILTC